MKRVLLVIVVLLSGSGRAHAAETRPLELADGDRVVFLGSTYIERMQSYDYLETLLTAAYSDRNITFRNLGWSGDDVTGLARAVFGQPIDGFKRLERDLVQAKPTVIIVCYGGNEAHAGEAGLSEFEAGLNRLLETISQTKARIVIASPMSYENVGSPLPDPNRYNTQLRKYCEVLASVANDRELPFIDLYQRLDAIQDVSAPPSIRTRLTDNGLHLNEFGYWRTASRFARALGADIPAWKVDLDVATNSMDVTGTMVSEVKTTDKEVSFSVVDQTLPFSPAPNTSPRGGKLAMPHSIFRIRGLAEGQYGLQIDNRPTILADEKQWAAGVHIYRGEYLPQVEKLRLAIQKKNELHFHRHRPQNETYLFLFRKHEQGNNAVEIPQFDPLIESQEKQIANLSKPTKNTYRLVRVDEK